jgi:hypothetical protein
MGILIVKEKVGKVGKEKTGIWNLESGIRIQDSGNNDLNLGNRNSKQFFDRQSRSERDNGQLFLLNPES